MRRDAGCLCFSKLQEAETKGSECWCLLAWWTLLHQTMSSLWPQTWLLIKEHPWASVLPAVRHLKTKDGPWAQKASDKKLEVGSRGKGPGTCLRRRGSSPEQRGPPEPPLFPICGKLPDLMWALVHAPGGPGLCFPAKAQGSQEQWRETSVNPHPVAPHVPWFPGQPECS